MFAWGVRTGSHLELCEPPSLKTPAAFHRGEQTKGCLGTFTFALVWCVTHVTRAILLGLSDRRKSIEAGMFILSSTLSRPKQHY